MKLTAFVDRGTVESLKRTQELFKEKEHIDLMLSTKLKGPVVKNVSSSTWMALSVDVEPLLQRTKIKLKNTGRGVVKIGVGSDVANVKEYCKINPKQTISISFSGDTTIKVWGQAESIISSLRIEEE